LGYDTCGNHSFGVPWGQLNAVHRDNRIIRAIQDAQLNYAHSPRQALRLRLRRFRWIAIFIYGASAAFGILFWLLVLRLAAHIH
jgi:hypothetical protein